MEIPGQFSPEIDIYVDSVRGPVSQRGLNRPPLTAQGRDRLLPLILILRSQPRLSSQTKTHTPTPTPPPREPVLLPGKEGRRRNREREKPTPLQHPRPLFRTHTKRAARQLTISAPPRRPPPCAPPAQPPPLFPPPPPSPPPTQPTRPSAPHLLLLRWPLLL